MTTSSGDTGSQRVFTQVLPYYLSALTPEVIERLEGPNRSPLAGDRGRGGQVAAIPAAQPREKGVCFNQHIQPPASTLTERVACGFS